MSNDLRKLADANYYFGEIKLWLDARTNHNLGLIVEGKFDQIFYSKLLSENVTFFPVDGCYNALEIIEKINPTNYPGIIAIIDSDFRRILGIQKHLKKICFLSDHHDSEMMLVNSSAWNEVINFYCIKSKKIDFEKSVGVSLKEYLLKLIKPIASVRYLNVIEDLGLIFKTITNGKCYFIDYKFFLDSEELSLNMNNLLVAIENKSQRPGFFSRNQKYITDIQDIMGKKYDLLEFCCGHDFMNALSIALENVISNKKSSRKVDHFDLENAFIIAFTFNEFMKTNLYESLIDWEQTSDFKLF